MCHSINIIQKLQCKVNRRVRITLLAHPNMRFGGSILSGSEKGVELKVEYPIMPGELLKVEWINLLLGETSCLLRCGDDYVVLLLVEHSLNKREDLARCWQIRRAREKRSIPTKLNSTRENEPVRAPAPLGGGVG